MSQPVSKSVSEEATGQPQPGEVTTLNDEARVFDDGSPQRAASQVARQPVSRPLIHHAFQCLRRFWDCPRFRRLEKREKRNLLPYPIVLCNGCDICYRSYRALQRRSNIARRRIRLEFANRLIVCHLLQSPAVGFSSSAESERGEQLAGRVVAARSEKLMVSHGR